MGLSGSSGPYRGAYNTFSFATASVQQAAGAGAIQRNMWTYTIPAGMDIELVDVQVYCASVSTATRVNVLAGGASVFQTISAGSAEQLSGILLVSNETSGVGNSNVATLSTNVFGTTATSITNSVTPSSPGNVINRGRAYGAYVMGGATLCATVSNLGSPQGVAGQITGTILWFPRSHPSALRSGTE